VLDYTYVEGTLDIGTVQTAVVGAKIGEEEGGGDLTSPAPAQPSAPAFTLYPVKKGYAEAEAQCNAGGGHLAYYSSEQQQLEVGRRGSTWRRCLPACVPARTVFDC
jgi:hypothetical protein